MNKTQFVEAHRGCHLVACLGNYRHGPPRSPDYLFQCVHAQVTFMHLEPSSSSSSLRPLDVEFMRRLSKVVNIVPVIAKADTLTLEERDFFKQTVRGVFRCIRGCIYALGILRWDLLSSMAKQDGCFG